MGWAVGRVTLLPRVKRVLAVLLLGWVLALATPRVAVALDGSSDPTDSCFTLGAEGQPEPCDDGGFGTGHGAMDGFVVLFVLVAVVGVGITIYKVAMARDMACKSGMDAGQATAMTLLTDDGLEATYLASNLRPTAAAPAPAPEPAPARSVSDRLAELDGLLKQGQVTQAEYDERRAKILDSL
jgi:hypothetical protein